MQTRFVANFNKRTLINLDQRRDHTSNLLFWLKSKLHLDPKTTFGSCAFELGFAEIYVGNIYAYLKRTLGDFYTQKHIEIQIYDTLLHEDLHRVLHCIGCNSEENVGYVIEKLRGFEEP